MTASFYDFWTLRRAQGRVLTSRIYLPVDWCGVHVSVHVLSLDRSTPCPFPAAYSNFLYELWLRALTVCARFECVYNCTPDAQQELRDFFHALDLSFQYFTLFGFDCSMERM
jgi:hypothetical protein